MTKYFSCSWLSDFSGESELLFIGGRNCLVFQDILDTVKSNHYGQFIVALSVLDRLRAGHFFETNKSIKEKVEDIQDKSLKGIEGIKGFDDKLKILVKALIDHEMSRYDRKYSELKVLKTTAKYIGDLLHYICINRTSVYINLLSMNCDVSEYYINGYQGYLFLKKYFCHEKYEWINLKFITKLYPNVGMIYVSALPIINIKEILEDILIYFFEEINTKLNQLELKPKQEMDKLFVNELIISYNHRFKTIGFLIEEHEFVDTNKGIIIKKL